MDKYDSHSSRHAALVTEAEDSFEEDEWDADPASERTRPPAAKQHGRRMRASPRASSRAGGNRPDARDRNDDGAESPETAEDDFEDESSRFLRTRERAPIRRRRLASSRFGRSAIAVLIVVAAVGIFLLSLATRNFFRSDPLFRIDSTSAIEITGNQAVPRAELVNIFGSDIGRNVFFVPLAERRAELEQIPWVQRATVMRVLPNRLRVAVTERVPIAFVRLGNTVDLIDAQGVLLRMSPSAIAARHYSFPVIGGIRRNDPPEVRESKAAAYQKFIAALDAGAANAAAKISEVIVSDPDDIRALIPENGSEILIHFGNTNYLDRFQRFQQHIADWERQYPALASVDLRYDSQAVLDMAPAQPAKAAAPSSVAGSHTVARSKKTVKKAPRTARKARAHVVRRRR